MSRLRNRIRKADYFTDGELLRWPRDKRTTYSGLWALAEDSGCLEDDPFVWKMSLWPSPLDDDLTITVLQQWRDELVGAGKLIPYEAGGKRLLFIRTFHTHEHPRNPQSPMLPLPAWVIHDQIEPKRGDSTVKRNAYRVVTSLLPSQNDDSTVTVTSPRSCPVLSLPVLSLYPLSDSDESTAPIPSNAKGISPKTKAPSDADWQARADAALDASHFPSDMLQLAGLRAGENKTGEMRTSRLVRELYEPLVELQDSLSDDALRHGMRAAIAAGAPNKTYVKRAALSYRPLAGVAGNSAAADLTDYDRDFLTD